MNFEQIRETYVELWEMIAKEFPYISRVHYTEMNEKCIVHRNMKDPPKGKYFHSFRTQVEVTSFQEESFVNFDVTAYYDQPEAILAWEIEVYSSNFRRSGTDALCEKFNTLELASYCFKHVVKQEYEKRLDVLLDHLNKGESISNENLIHRLSTLNRHQKWDEESAEKVEHEKKILKHEVEQSDKSEFDYAITKMEDALAFLKNRSNGIHLIHSLSYSNKYGLRFSISASPLIGG